MGHRFLDDSGLVSKPWGEYLEFLYRLGKFHADSEADGTYTLGLGSTDGEITLTNGFITAVQEVVA